VYVVLKHMATCLGTKGAKEHPCLGTAHMIVLHHLNAVISWISCAVCSKCVSFFVFYEYKNSVTKALSLW